MRRKLLVLTMAALFVVLVAPSRLSADAGPDGAALYKAKCAMCHGPDGAGQTPTGKAMKVRDLRSPEVQKMSNAELNKVISDGKGKMPAYRAKLTQADIDALITFIHTLRAK